jgi:hypothetical protein
MVSDYFAELMYMLERQFPEGDPGEDPGYFFLSDYVTRNNKRRIVFFVQHGVGEITRVTYVLPVSAEAAPIFGEDDVMPHTIPTFSEMTGPIEEYVEANNLVEWRKDLARIVAAEAAAEPGKLKRTLKNVKLYWRDMRSRLYDAIFSTGIRMLRTSSGRTRSSEVQRRTRRRQANSPVPANPVRTPPRSRSRSRSRNRNRNTRRRVIVPAQRKKTRRGPIGNLSDPQPGSYKSNSDPADI